MAKKKRIGKLRPKVLKEYAEQHGPDAGSPYRAKGGLGRNAREQTITEKEETTILTCLRMGGSRADALKLIGLSGSAADLMLLGQKTKRHPDFKAMIEQAEAEGKHHHLTKIHDGDPQWRASAWMLERKWWREFARRTPESYTRDQVVMLMMSLSQTINNVVKSSALRHEIATRASDLLAGMGMRPSGKREDATGNSSR